MSGFRKYIVIIGAAFLLLWLISIIIYRETILTYIAQKVGGFIEAAVLVVVVLVTIAVILRAII